MIEIIISIPFEDWLLRLRDRQARQRIQMRIDRMSDGNLGDVKPVGEGISEARIHYGPGYRLYFTRQGQTIILLLLGGDKSTQDSDIARAYRIAKEWKGTSDE